MCDTLPFCLQAQGKPTAPSQQWSGWLSRTLLLFPMCECVAQWASSWPGSGQTRCLSNGSRDDSSTRSDGLGEPSNGGYFVLMPCAMRKACCTQTYTHAHFSPLVIRNIEGVDYGWTLPERVFGRGDRARKLPLLGLVGSCFCCPCPSFLRPRRPGTLNGTTFFL